MSKPTTTKEIRVMFTPFRDGLQSLFGGKTRLKDILPAMEASAQAGIRHFEFGGGARFQAPYFYVGENPFECMSTMRDAVGSGVDLQILTRSVSGVTLTTQRLKALELQAQLMKKHGTTWDRNFDYMNDVENLIKTGKPIVDAGMHHQVCIALMGLPFHSDKVHTAEFYVNVIRKLLKSDLHFDSVCLKDASGTTDPQTIYDTITELKKILPAEVLIWLHTHDTASMAVACYRAGIDAGVDGIDLSVRPMASGTVQPDVRSMAHALKGTGYTLDIEVGKMREIENLLVEGLKDYEFNPVTTTPDARVLGFPMPGGAIGPNVHMMQKAGILHKYGEVLEEFPVVVEAGGAWTSVTPGSQQYWLQAFNNVLHGRWKKIEAGFGRAILGYFGRPPLPPDPKVVEIAAEQLELEVFTGDPLEAAADNLTMAEEALKERDLPITDENRFLVAASIVPGKDLELNEGIRLISGKPKIVLPLKKVEEKKDATVSAPASAAAPSVMAMPTGTITTDCTVEEGGKTRQFRVTIQMPGGNGQAVAQVPAALPSGGPAPAADSGGQVVPVYSPFEGTVEVVEIKVKVGDMVKKSQVVAGVEAMKAKHDVKAPIDGTVASVDATLGTEVSAGVPILTIRG
ncbi:MAG TPA: biotin attachment protein [Verrucomicrobiales bacterium]|nr:biotin attachment protein [Verrucomicrobiales bacterium]